MPIDEQRSSRGVDPLGAKDSGSALAERTYFAFPAATFGASHTFWSASRRNALAAASLIQINPLRGTL